MTRGTAQVERPGDKVREARLRCCGHVQRRDSEDTGKMILNMEVEDRRKRGKQQIRFMDVVKENTKRVGVTEEDVRDRVRWRQIVPLWRTLKKASNKRG